jgi:integrase
MPTIEIDAKLARRLACEPDKTETTFWDAGLPGFGLRCRRSGARTWFCQYRVLTGDTRKHALGDPVNVTYADARKTAGQLIAKVKLGGDPAGEVAAKKAEVRAAIRLGELIARYEAHQGQRLKPRSFEELHRNLHKGATALHERPAGKVSQRDIVDLLQETMKRGPIAANRLRAALSGLYAWGMKAGLVTANPVVATFRPAEERSRDRVLSDGELALIWSCTGRNADHDRIVRLLLLTGARRDEVAGMRWGEIARNEDGSVTWSLPAERTKNGRPHELVLPAFAAGLLPPGRDGRELVFGEGTGPFSGWSQCKARLDRRIAKANDGAPIACRLHDLRRTFVTRLNDKLRVEPHVIEALVNHVGGIAKAGVAGVYNRAAYSEQKREALALWCDYVVRLSGANVVPLRQAAG